MRKRIVACVLVWSVVACSSEKGSDSAPDPKYLEKSPSDLLADAFSAKPSKEFTETKQRFDAKLDDSEKKYVEDYNLAEADGGSIAKDQRLKAPRKNAAKALRVEIDPAKEADPDTAAEALAETLSALREVQEDAESCADLPDDQVLNCAVAWLLLEVQRSRADAKDAGAGKLDAEVEEEDAGVEEPEDAGAVEGDAGAAQDAGATKDASAGGDAGPLACGASGSGSQLATFRPSNLPADFDLPADAPDFLGTNEFDTDSFNWYYKLPTLVGRAVTLQGGGEAAVLVVKRFELGSAETLTIRGQRPLIIVAREDIVLNGKIVAAASATNGYAAGGAPGPSVPERKGFGIGGGAAGQGSASAGSGGSFCGRGGRGFGQTTDGTTYGTPELVPLVAGSSGGVRTSVGGLAGGAVQLVAGISITIGETGIISMVGSGGPNYGGGSSGGAILLEAPKVSVLGTLSANGGSGGGYYQGVVGTLTSSPAPGAAAPMKHGGDGSAAEVVNGGDGVMATYQGGGGGGAGRVRVNTGCGQATLGPNYLITPAVTSTCYSAGALTAR